MYRAAKDLRQPLQDKNSCQHTLSSYACKLVYANITCQTPFAHNEVTKEICLIFMAKCCTCLDRDDWLEVMRCKLQCSSTTESDMQNLEMSLITVSDCARERQHKAALPSYVSHSTSQHCGCFVVYNYLECGRESLLSCL